MAHLTVVMTCLILLLGTAGGVSVKCHSCVHYKYTSSDSSLSSFLNGISTLNENCLKNDKDYEEVYEESCFGKCLKEFGTAVLRYGTSRVDFEIAQRGCRTDPPAITCAPLTVEGIVEEHGFTVESEDVTGCYCDDDHCNHGNAVVPGMVVILSVVLLTLGVLSA